LRSFPASRAARTFFTSAGARTARSRHASSAGAACVGTPTKPHTTHVSNVARYRIGPSPQVVDGPDSIPSRPRRHKPGSRRVPACDPGALGTFPRDGGRGHPDEQATVEVGERVSFLACRGRSRRRRYSGGLPAITTIGVPAAPFLLSEMDLASYHRRPGRPVQVRASRRLPQREGASEPPSHRLVRRSPDSSGRRWKAPGRDGGTTDRRGCTQMTTGYGEEETGEPQMHADNGSNLRLVSSHLPLVFDLSIIR